MPTVDLENGSSEVNPYIRTYLIKDYRGEECLVFPGLGYWELQAVPIERRRQFFVDAVAAREEREKARLPDKDVADVFSDLEFDYDPKTGEVLS